ncbi:MAG: hypothetical protein ACXWIU_02855 [Limisphaerales bacterium]
MVRGAQKQSNTSLMYFFVALGMLLLVSTMMPSCHSRHGQSYPWHRRPDAKVRAHYPATKIPTAPTPPAKPATAPTPAPHH